MARYKLTCRKRAKPQPSKPPRKHKRIASFIAAYEALCKSDIKPRSRFNALEGMMEEVKSSFGKELREIDSQRRRVLSQLHIGEEKNKGFRKNHDSNGGDGGAGAGGSGAGAGIAAGGFFDNF